MKPVWNALSRFLSRNAAVPRYVAMRNAREAQKAVELATGPPPTEAELAEARSRIAKQRARDEGVGGLF